MKKDLIMLEYLSWREKFDTINDGDYSKELINFLSTSRYLKDIWGIFKKKFDSMYRNIGENNLLKSKFSNFDKNSLMVQMFSEIFDYYKLNFYQEYINYERIITDTLPNEYKNKYFLSTRISKSGELEGKVKQGISIRNGKKFIIRGPQLKDYVLKYPEKIGPKISDFFIVPNILVAILKKNKKLLDEQIKKAKRNKLVEGESHSLELYKDIIKGIARLKKEKKEPSRKEIKEIADQISDKDRYRWDLYRAFKRWKERNQEDFNKFLRRYMKELENPSGS